MVVHKANVGEHIKYDVTFLNTFKNYMYMLVEKVEQTIHKTVLHLIALMFNEQTTSNDQYVKLFPASFSNNLNWFSEACLTMPNIVALIVDKCSFNQSITTKRNIPLIGCSTHCFQSAVNDLFERK